VKIADEAEVRRRSEFLDKRTDRRTVEGKVEIKASVSIPVTRSTPWTVDTAEELIVDPKGTKIAGSVKGVRRGSQWNIEVSVQIKGTQLELL